MDPRRGRKTCSIPSPQALSWRLATLWEASSSPWRLSGCGPLVPSTKTRRGVSGRSGMLRRGKSSSPRRAGAASRWWPPTRAGRPATWTPSWKRCSAGILTPLQQCSTAPRGITRLRGRVVPSLVQLADPSDLVPPDQAERLVEAGFEVRVVAGAGHSIHRDDYEGFVAGLDAWL